MKINEVFGGSKELRDKLRGLGSQQDVKTNPTPDKVRTFQPDEEEFPPKVDDFRQRNKLYRDPNADEKLAKTKAKKSKQQTSSDDDSKYIDYRDEKSKSPDGKYVKGTIRSMDELDYIGTDVQAFVEEFKKQCSDVAKREVNLENQQTYNPRIRIEKVTETGYNYSLDLETKNGIDVNISLNAGQKNLPNKARIYFRGGLKSKEQIVLDALDENGIRWARDGGEGTNTAPSVDLNTVVSEAKEKDKSQILASIKDKLKNFWKVVDAVEGLGDNFELQSTRKIYKTIKRKPSHMRFYVGAALLMFVAVKFKMPSLLARGGSNGKNNDGLFDVRDEDIIVAYSEAGKNSVVGGAGRWREHLVPCDYIQRMAVEMINNHQSKEVIDMELIFQVAGMIRRNLAIAIISDEERKKLDHGPRNLKSTMPDGWKEGDSILARLNHVGIQVFSADDGTPLNNPQQSAK